MDTAAVKASSELSEEDSLASLEDRIRRTVEMVTTLRDERDAAVADRDAARKAAGAALTEAQQMRAELDSLRGERKQVRTRIEKLLGQIDLLSGA